MTELEQPKQENATLRRQRDTLIAVVVHKATDIANNEQSKSANQVLKEIGLEKEFTGVPVKRWKP
jgi:hypothetical protein